MRDIGIQAVVASGQSGENRFINMFLHVNWMQVSEGILARTANEEQMHELAMFGNQPGAAPGSVETFDPQNLFPSFQTNRSSNLLRLVEAVVPIIRVNAVPP